MHVRNLGCPFPLQNGGLNTTFFRGFCNIAANFTAYIFGTKHGIGHISGAGKSVANHKESDSVWFATHWTLLRRFKTT